MTNNNKILLDEILERGHKEDFPEWKPDRYFEYFVADAVMRRYDLSTTELADGLTGSDDGGIDSQYLIANGIIARETGQAKPMPSGNRLEIIICQAKRESGFKETAVQKLADTLSDVLTLSKSLAELSHLYGIEIVEFARVTREYLKAFALKETEISINVHYGTVSTEPEIHPKVQQRVTDLKTDVSKISPDYKVHFEFLGARELLSRHRQQTIPTKQLPIGEGPISPGAGSSIILVDLKEYWEFVTVEVGNVRSLDYTLFESNVRDFEGTNDVNKRILKSLSEGKYSFWWLNNGITIIAASSTNKTGTALELDDVQIVNGLQTTRMIDEHFQTSVESSKNQQVLVRIIVTSDEAARDEIIRATNSQTSVTASMLRATDPFQRDIELHLEHHGLFYERRKNFYRNRGRAKSRILGITFLAQCVLALVLERPDDARARPTSLITRDVDYEHVFDPDRPLDLYLHCAEVMLMVGDVLGGIEDATVRQYCWNFRFQIALCLLWTMKDSDEEVSETLQRLSSIDQSEIEPTVLLVANYVTELATKEEVQREWEADRIAKSQEFNSKLSSTANRLKK